jgi:hypothetical protein
MPISLSKFLCYTERPCVIGSSVPPPLKTSSGAAQEEIWKTSQEEVLQLKQQFPRLAKYMGAPCWVRKEANVKPFCPEGDHFCGVTVWKLPVENYERLI